MTQVLFPQNGTHGGGFVSHTYERNGWLKRSQGQRTRTDYSYNPRGFLTGLYNSAVSDHRLLSSFTGMTYDAAGNRRTETAQIPAIGMAPDASWQQSYSYDKRGELMTDQSAPSQQGSPLAYSNTFAYDAAQNPTTFRSNTPGYNADNQIADGSGNFPYDGNGNPQTYQGGIYNFDPENRMIYAPTLLPGGTVTAKYDGDGLRASKTALGATTYYLYDGDTPLVELNSSGAVQALNGYGADGWRGRYYPGSLTFPNSTTPQSTSEYGKQGYEYLYDPQGNLVQRQRQYNNAADVMDTALYDAYGLPIADTDVATGQLEAYQDPVGFGGQHGYYHDTETGLSLLTNRYYASKTGRFITRDPIGYSGGINLYGFAGNNPVNMMDPNGTDAVNNLSNFFAGWGDTLTLGATGRVRQWIGVDDVVDRSSGAYAGGVVVGTAQGFVEGGAGALSAVRALRAAGGIRATISAARAIPLAARLTADDAKLASFAARVKSIPGYFDIVVHGTPNGFQVLRGGKWIDVSHRSLATFIQKSGYNGEAIRLISCDTGALANGVAKKLANKLGVEVLAPNKIAYLHGNGNITIGGIYRNTGNWVKFLPGK